jgi:hypothetical protein
MIEYWHRFGRRRAAEPILARPRVASAVVPGAPLGRTVTLMPRGCSAFAGVKTPAQYLSLFAIDQAWNEGTLALCETPLVGASFTRPARFIAIAPLGIPCFEVLDTPMIKAAAELYGLWKVAVRDPSRDPHAAHIAVSCANLRRG